MREATLTVLGIVAISSCGALSIAEEVACKAKKAVVCAEVAGGCQDDRTCYAAG